MAVDRCFCLSGPHFPISTDTITLPRVNCDGIRHRKSTGTQWHSTKDKSLLCLICQLGTVFPRMEHRSVSTFYILQGKVLLTFVLLIKPNGINHMSGRNSNVCYTELSTKPGSAPSCPTLISGHGLLRLLPLMTLRSHTTA